MFKKLANIATGMFKDGERMLNRAIDKATFKRIVYAAYLIASADGDFDSDEKASLVKLINRDFPDFDTQDIMKAIQECDDKIAFDKVLDDRDEQLMARKICKSLNLETTDYGI